MMELKDITIVEDSRQQTNKHELKNKFFEENGIRVLRSKLPFGDYEILGKGNLIVDTKKDFLELAGNLTKDHIRFRNEIVNANSYGIGLVILIEEDDYYANLEVFKNYYITPKWKSTTFKTVNGKRIRVHTKGEAMAKFDVSALVKAMKTMQEKYAVIFKFTTKERCGQDILNILYYKADKYNEYFKNKLSKKEE